MKRLTNVLLIGLAFFAMATMSYAAITGSAHDFQNKTWNTSGEICIVCHTPHNAIAETNAPLWNHEVTAANFTPYSGFDLQATVGQPSGASKLCLSCHDGTVAIDSFGGTTGTNNITGGALLGTDLSNDHPISFTYDATLATSDGELVDPSTGSSGLTGTIAQDLLFGGNLECASCHDVHNNVGTNGTLLRIDNSGSALCLTCHSK